MTSNLNAPKIDKDAIEELKRMAKKAISNIEELINDLDGDCYFDIMRAFSGIIAINEICKSAMKGINSSLLAGYALLKYQFPVESSLIAENKERELSIFEKTEDNANDELNMKIKGLFELLTGKKEGGEEKEESQVNKELREKLLKKAGL